MIENLIITFEYLYQSLIFIDESFLLLSSQKLKIHDLFTASRGERSEVVLNECWTSDEKFDNESFEAFVMGAKWYDNCQPWNLRTNGPCQRTIRSMIDPTVLIKLHNFYVPV